MLLCCCRRPRQQYHSRGSSIYNIHTKICIKFCCEKEISAKNSFNALPVVQRKSSSSGSVLQFVSFCHRCRCLTTQFHICWRTYKTFHLSIAINGEWWRHTLRRLFGGGRIKLHSEVCLSKFICFMCVCVVIFQICNNDISTSLSFYFATSHGTLAFY